MATSLAKQLERLAAPQSALLVHKKSRPSLLFDKREAALLDRDTVFSIGVDGFEDLLNLNPAFIKYQETLFSENAKTMERSVQTKEVNDKLDEVIEEFLCLLCPYFLLKPAHKALEWLIYRFHIQDFNVNALLRCIFPYHDTNIFVRALQLLRVREETNRWHWLYPLQNPGVPLSKGALAARCAENLGFMKFLCVMNKKIIKVHGTSSAALHAPVSFFISALCSALERCSAVSEQQVSLLVPHLLRSLRSPLQELRAGGYMVTSQLARRAALSAELTGRLFTALTKSLSEPLVSECVAALAVLAQTQALQRAPSEALEPLGAITAELTSALTDLGQRCSVLPLVSCLLRTCLLESAGGDAAAAAMATALTTDVRMEVPQEQDLIIRCVSSLFTEAESEAAPLLAAVVPVLTAMERQYPAPFDAALGGREAGGRRGVAALRSALRGRVAGAVGCGVFVDLHHPEESTRFEAVKQLMTSLRKDEATDRDLVRSALLSALDDPSDRIVKQALKVPVEACLRLVDAEELSARLTACLDAGHGEPVWWLCAGRLARLSVLREEEEPGRPLDAALLTALLPTTWTDQTAQQLTKLTAQPVCPGLASFLAASPTCSHSEYLCAALEQLCRRLGELAGPTRRHTLAALAGRLARGDRPRAVRLAAAALVATALRTDGDGALQVLLPLQPLLQDGKVKVSGRLSAATTPSQLLCDPEQASVAAGLLCTLSAVIDSASDTEVTELQWWCAAAGPSERLAALTALYGSTAVGLSLPRSRSRPLHQALIAALFKERLTTLASQVSFLAQFWSAPADGSEPTQLTAQVAALVMAAALLSAAPPARLTPLLAPGAPLMPTLLVALQSPLAQVRTAAMDCVQKVSGLKAAKAKCPLLPLAAQLVTFQQEITTDVGAVPLCLAEGGRGWLPQLVEVVVSEAVPDHVRAALASLLPPLADQNTLRTCMPVVSGLLSEAGAGAGAAGPAALSAAQSLLAGRLLQLLTPATACCLSEPAVWQTVSAALAAETATLRLPDGDASPQSVLLKQVTKAVFSALDGATQSQLLTRLVDLCTDTQQSAVASRIHKVLKRVPLTAELLVQQLAGQDEEQLEPAKKAVREARTTRRRAAAAAATPGTPANAPATPAALPDDEATIDCRAWRRRRVVLEVLQARRRLDQPDRLLDVLFPLLRRLLRLQDQPAAEYLKQLSLTCLQQTCDRLRQAGGPPRADLQARFSVETLVQCVRSSDSPQTHQLALIVLSMAAQMLPEMVLHNIMAVFTFMGSSMLRQDNEYSFRVIEKTVESVVPALLQASSLVSAGGDVMPPVLRVFVDAVRDVPGHRRLPLFTHLLRTVGERRHLWVCLAMLADQLATRGDVPDKVAQHTVTVVGERSAAVLVEFAVSLSGQFPLEVQLESCSRLLQHTEMLMDRRHDQAGAAPRGAASRSGVDQDMALFDLDAHADKQFYKHCHTAVSIIAQLLASEAFVAQSASLEAAGAAAAQAQHQRLLERAVRLITSCTQLCQTTLRGRPDDVRHVRAILHRLYALLDKVNSLLPSAMFLSVVSGLLSSELPVVRRRAMELLATRLQLQPDYFTEADTEALLRLTQELVSVAQSAPDGDSEAEEGSALNRQTALFALKLISRLLAGKHPADFIPVLRAVCELAVDQTLAAALFASCLLCMAELCASLRAHAIGRLPAMAAALLAVLGDNERLSNELVLMSAVTLAHKLAESLPNFISPYLPELLGHVCRLSATHAARGATSPLQHRLRQTRHQLATAVPVRVLVPAIDQCFQRLAADGSAGGLRQLMAVLAEAEAAAELTQLSSVLPQLQALILRGLEHRCADRVDAAAARQVERDVIGAVTSLVPRLSETTFRPFFVRLLDWASRADAPPTRLITFYRLTDALAERLKGLFVLFAGHFIRHLATVLEGTSSLSESPTLPDDEEGSCELAEYALDTLAKVCSHDTEGFLNKERFHVLMQPLVDQLENTEGSEERRELRLREHLVPCLVSFLAAAGDDSLWKPANYQLLLKMRHQSAQVRLAAVAALSAVHSRLGDDYMTLLPETMPFLAELLEDEEPRVEAATQTLIKEMEETLGESLQKYF